MSVSPCVAYAQKTRADLQRLLRRVALHAFGDTVLSFEAPEGYEPDDEEAQGFYVDQAFYIEPCSKDSEMGWQVSMVGMLSSADSPPEEDHKFVGFSGNLLRVAEFFAQAMLANKLIDFDAEESL